MTPLQIDGPDDATVTLLLAHGAGAGMDHEWMATVARGLAERGLRVVRFEFPYMHARREGRRPGPDRMPKLLACYREVFDAQQGPVILAGKSMGGRAATMLADDVPCAGVVAFGYPFHPPGKPDNLRTAHLETMRTPTLIVQGERDPFGTRDEVGGYDLSAQIRLRWIDDGDHSLKPRKKSGFTMQGNLAKAMDAAVAFAGEVTA
jgi:predicted alpha/beta-hydrolase family hydrolase